MSSFSLSFTIDVDQKRRIVYCKIFGLWKREIADEYREAFRSEVAPLTGAPWAKLVDLTNWRTSYQDVVGVLGKHMRWGVDSGCEMSLYVLNNPSTFRQLNEMFRTGRVTDSSHTFRTFPEAVTYLKAHWPAARKPGEISVV